MNRSALLTRMSTHNSCQCGQFQVTDRWLLGESARLQDCYTLFTKMELNEDNSQNANMLAKSINALGGPDHATEDFAWASSMPQGRSLLEWLSSQIQCQNLVLKGKGPDEAIAYQASLQPIALHDQELLELVRDSLSDDWSSGLVPIHND